MNSEIYPGEERAPAMQEVGVEAGGGVVRRQPIHEQSRVLPIYKRCKRGSANQRGTLRYIETPNFPSCQVLFGSRRIKSHAEIFAWNTKSTRTMKETAKKGHFGSGLNTRSL